jgi:CubicO group peptidase (beta-lactamase class C family)
MKKIISFAIVAAVVSAAYPAGLAQTEDPFKTQLEPMIEQAMKLQDLPGFAIAVVRDQKIVYTAGFGVRNLDRKDDKITPQSLFHMASITKPFVATSVMQLVEQGKVDLDSPVVKYLPYFRLKDERYKTITVRQMLGHISGMPDVQDYEWDKPQYDDGALERYTRSLTDKSLIADPGTKFAYSNMAFEVLGDLIAKVSGETFEGYVQKHILEPLKMTSSTLLVKQAAPQLLTTGHVLSASFYPAVSKVFPYNRMHSPSSTLYSNVLDMSRWAMANMNRGELDGKRILKASAYDVMWKPAGEQFTRVGISWFLGKHRDLQTIGHGGGDTGFVSNLLMIPDKKVAVVMMCNFDGGAALGQLTNAALDIALGLKPAPLAIRLPVARALGRTITTSGIEPAIAQYRELKTNQPQAYDFSEAQLNTLGYRLMQQGKLKEAIRVLQLNVEVYPQSGNVYDSLGEAYMRNGDKQLAIENYEKSLKLDPANANAVEMLKKLRAN